MNNTGLLLVFVKYPVPGRVKTRLAAAVGDDRATHIYQWLVRETLRQLPAGQAVRVLYDAFRPEPDYRAWLEGMGMPRDLEYQPQAGGDLGQRLIQAFAGAFADGWERVAVIGSDCPWIDADIYTATWQALATHEVVIGPSTDGGYYLLALRKECGGLFENIAWSTGEVLEQTVAAARGLGLSVHLLPALTDVDTVEDWERLLMVSPQARLSGI